jgi:hypothetical protein
LILPHFLKCPSPFTFSLNDLKEPEYKVNVYYTKGPDYGNVKIYANNQLAGEIKGYRGATLICIDARYLPAANDAIDHPVGLASEQAASAKRQFVNAADRYPMWNVQI